MKKVLYTVTCCLLAGALASCGGNQKKTTDEQTTQTAASTTVLTYSKSMKAPEDAQLTLPVDADGYITLFDGKSLEGWRGYGKDKVSTRVSAQTEQQEHLVGVHKHRRRLWPLACR